VDGFAGCEDTGSHKLVACLPVTLDTQVEGSAASAPPSVRGAVGGRGREGGTVAHVIEEVDSDEDEDEDEDERHHLRGGGGEGIIAGVAGLVSGVAGMVAGERDV